MKRPAFFFLAIAASAFGQTYTYYYTDSLTTSTGNWTQNGTPSFTSSGLTSASAGTLVADANIPPPPPASQTSYEVKMTLNLTQSGGTFGLQSGRSQWQANF
jgi:hypothetical protein